MVQSVKCAFCFIKLLLIFHKIFLIFVSRESTKYIFESIESICGDLNINLLNMDSRNGSANLYNLLSSNGFLPLILHPSRVVENQNPSLIDNIFTNNTNSIILSGNIYLTISEHFSQFASLQHDRIDVKNIDMYARNYSNYSDEKFRDDVSIQVWSHPNITDVNFLAGDFVWRLDGSAERNAPIEKLKPKQIKLKLKPWITDDIKKTHQNS